MASPHRLPDVVFVLDVDHTLLDPRGFEAEWREHLEEQLGPAAARRYLGVCEQLRREHGFADPLAALQRYRQGAGSPPGDAHALLQISSFLLDFPYQQQLLPRALDLLALLQAMGPTLLVIEGDVTWLPRRLQRSGLWDAVGGRVLLCARPEQALPAVQRQHEAQHHVWISARRERLLSVKMALQQRVTTVWLSAPPQPGGAGEDTLPMPLAEEDIDITLFDLDELIAMAAHKLGQVHEGAR